MRAGWWIRKKLYESGKDGDGMVGVFWEEGEEEGEVARMFLEG